MQKTLCFSSFAIFLTALSIIAGPKIEFDTKTFNAGDIIEGTTNKVPATFIVKNTGDAPLKLLTVKPSCGCTVVKFDSTIQPGQSTKIESAVNIPGYRKSQYTKSITVRSNAPNDSVVRLAIEFSIISAIEVSANAVDFDTTALKTPQSVTLTSKMKDLKVTEVKLQNDAQTVPLKYTWSKTDSTTQNGMYVFKLDLFRPANVKTGNGTINIATNHKDMKSVSLTGHFH